MHLTHKGENKMELKTLQITVCEDTAADLQKTAEAMGLSLGEVIDRLVMLRMKNDAPSAALLIGEYIMLYSTRLSEVEFSKVLDLVKELITDPDAGDKWEQNKVVM